ncbi:MAG: sigma-70 family RNA polymerase sigma factor, partial [Methylococcales bacterium]|nr:sigma-70 family RNA polymerase sigma factor [Methylococcales bacterium]
QNHAQFVYNLALRTLSNAQEAEDMTQEAFVRVWRYLPKYKATAKFQTWLYRIVINLCYNRLPHLKRDLSALETDEGVLTTQKQDSAETKLLTAELNEQLTIAIAALPETYRLLITLRHLQNMRYAEIAAVTQMPLGTVKTGIFRARRALQILLKPYLENSADQTTANSRGR